MQREIVQQPAQLCLGGLPLAGGGSPRGQRGDFQGPPACLPVELAIRVERGTLKSYESGTHDTERT